MTFAQMVADICGRLNLVSAEAIARVGAELNQYYRKVTATIGLEQLRYISRTGTTALNSDKVTFAGIEKIDRVFERLPDGQVQVLQPVLLAQLREQRDAQGSRQSYAVWLQDADSITILLPGLALAVTDLYADGWTTLADLTGSDEPSIPSSFHRILIDNVMGDEYLRKEKTDLADRYYATAEAGLRELRFHLADAPARDFRQGDNVIPGAGGGGTGGAGSSVITGDIVFDRDPGPPFHVTPGSGLVDNLDADKLDGQHGAFYQDAANHTGIVPAARLGPHAAHHQVGGPPGDVLDVRALGGYPANPATFLRGDGTFAAVPPPAPAPPLAHAPTHQAGGSDPLTVTALAGYPGVTDLFLRADGTFAAPAGGGGGTGTPGGANTQLQFNDAGAFAGALKAFWDKVKNRLTLTGDLVVQHDYANLALVHPSAPANQRAWAIATDGVTLQLQTHDDADAFVGAALVAQRNGNVSVAGALTVAGGEIVGGAVGTPTVLHPNTADGADASFTVLTGGGGNGNSQLRGASIGAMGNEHAQAGEVFLLPGNVAGSRINFYTSAAAIAAYVDGASGVLAVRRPAVMLGAGGAWDGATATLTWDLATGAAFREVLAGGFNAQFINPPPPGVEFVFSLQIDWSVSGAVVTWPASVTWDEDVAPVMPGSGRTIILGFSTINGGVRWRGYIGGRNFLT